VHKFDSTSGKVGLLQFNNVVHIVSMSVFEVGVVNCSGGVSVFQIRNSFFHLINDHLSIRSSLMVSDDFGEKNWEEDDQEHNQGSSTDVEPHFAV